VRLAYGANEMTVEVSQD